MCTTVLTIVLKISLFFRKTPKVPETLLKRRKRNEEVRAKKAKSAVMAKKVKRMLSSCWTSCKETRAAILT